MTPVLFAVLTWGSSGSTWLSKLLNAHPEVFCPHALGRHAQWQEAPRGRFVPNTGSVFTPVNAVAYYRWLATQPAAAAGEAHGVPIEAWTAVDAALSEHVTRGAVLVRHPIPRIASHVALHSASLPTKLRQRRLDPPYAAVHELTEQLGLGLPADDYGSLMFVQGCRQASRTALRQVRSPYPTFRIEDLGADPTAPSALLEHLSADRLTAFPDGVVERAQANRLGRHREHAASDDPGEIYETWTSWAKDVFDMFFDDEARQVTQELGYELPAQRTTTRLRPPAPTVRRSWRRLIGSILRDIRRTRRTHGTVGAAMAVVRNRLGR